MKSTGDANNIDTQAASRIFKTFGEVFADGSLIELVASANGDQLNLLYWNGESIVIAPQIEHGGRIYQAEELPPSFTRATRLPREPVGYGTILQLFTELRDAFEERLGFARPLAQLCTFWVLTTWFSDCLSTPPTLWASGADVDLAMAFLGLLHCLCRRALRLTGVTRAGFLSLPFPFNPVLLVNQPSLPFRLQSLWCESNSRGSVVPGGRGVVLDVTSSKAIFLGMLGIAPPPSAGNLHIALFPADHAVPLLDPRMLNEIADHFLPRLLRYRLDHAKEVRESQFVVPDQPFPTGDLARTLGACIQGDADLALQVVPLLSSQDDDVDRCSLDHAIIEVVWPRVHRTIGDTAAANMKIGAELTPEVSTFLLCCGETRQYKREEVGKRVAKLGLSTKPTNAGTVLLLDRQTSRRVHQLAVAYRIDKSVPECPDCQAVKPPVG